MKKFAFQTLLISFVSLSIILAILSTANGYTDPFYIRFTTPKQQNLILGTSRAAQGLQPKAFQQVLGKDISNFAFTIAHSPFGKVYYESIVRKHNKKEGGLFIVSVDPWSISSYCSPPNDLNQFRENELCLNKTKVVNLNPNFFYILDNLLDEFPDDLFRVRANSLLYLHQDGWLEVNNIKMDSASVAIRISNKAKNYRDEHLPKAKFSSVRLDYLHQTINYLKGYGSVYLVRLPIHQSIMEIDEELMPDFNQKLSEAIDLSNGYLDLTSKNDSFEYTDGNHLYKTSGQKVSTIIADWIKDKEGAAK